MRGVAVPDVREAREVAEEQIRHWQYWGVSSREANAALGYRGQRGWTRVRAVLMRWWLRNHNAVSGAEILNAFGAKPPVRPIHMGKLVSPEGHVSPLCAKVPRPIDLEKATWTNRPEAVTCPRCKRLLNLKA